MKFEDLLDSILSEQKEPERLPGKGDAYEAPDRPKVVYGGWNSDSILTVYINGKKYKYSGAGKQHRDKVKDFEKNSKKRNVGDLLAMLKKSLTQIEPAPK